MKTSSMTPRSARKTIGGLILAVGMVLTMDASLMPRAQAESGDAAKILKSMFSYIVGQKTIAVTFDADVEVITDNLQKLQFTGSGQVQLSRPDKLRATRTTGYMDVEMIFDGKTITVNSKVNNTFAQIESPGSIDQLVDLLRDKYGVSAPGADLLFSDAFDVLMEDVIDAKHIGRGVIDGVECEHLAFRNTDTDWQIWIELGARPIPRKYVITSKTLAAAPQYTLRIKDWKTDVPADAFAFKQAPGAQKVAFENLQDIDDVPNGSVKTGAKK